jgi:hypothetical protein
MISDEADCVLEDTNDERALDEGSDPIPLRRGGPEACPKPCVECHPAHHFSDALIEFAEEEDEDTTDGMSEQHPHPAKVAGCTAWYVCKHCPAWQEWNTDADLDDDLGPGKVCSWAKGQGF